MSLVHEGQLFLGIPGGADIKAFAVIFTKAKPFDGFPMFFCPITLIAIPAIVGELGMQTLHVFIPPGLGQDAGGGNRGKQGIPLYDTSIRDPLIAGKPVAVY